MPDSGKPPQGGQAGNSKSQIPNSKKITITEIQNSKHENDLEERTFQFAEADLNSDSMFRSLNIVIWDLFVIWCLVFEI
jgi:hypothetical protein